MTESAWEIPKEGFVSLADQALDADASIKHQVKAFNKQRVMSARVLEEEAKREQEEARAAAEREKMKERRVEPEPEPTVSGPILEPGKTDPYGKWQKVETRYIIDLNDENLKCLNFIFIFLVQNQ